MRMPKAVSFLKAVPVLFLMLSSLFVLAFSPAVFSAFYNASIVTDAGAPQNVYYYAAANAYVDGVTGTPQVKMRVYSTTAGSLAGKYVSFLYRAGDSYKIISVTPTANFAQLGTETPVGSNVYAESPLNLDFNSLLAAYPGKVYAIISPDPTVDMASDSLLLIPSSNGWLSGSFTTNNVQGSYNPTTRKVTVRVTGITGTTATGSSTITTDTNALAIGVCSDENGSSCVDSTLTSRVAVNLNTGVLPSTAQASPQTLYYVVNGIGSSFCIGNDLTASVSLNASSPEDGNVIGITAVVTNNGNVEVARDFNVSIYYDSILSSSLIGRIQVAGPVSVGGSQTVFSSWNTTRKSGAHTIIAVVDSSNEVPECTESNNQATAAMSVRTSYYVTLFIDGGPYYGFNDVGRPYNVTIHVNDSLGNNVSDAVVQLIEKNALTLNAPTQIWTEGAEKHGVVTYSIAEVVTNSSGRVAFTFVPSGNKLYDTNPSLVQYVGPYEITVKLFVGGALKRSLILTTARHTPRQATQRIYAQRQENVRASFELMNNIFVTQKRWFERNETHTN